MHLSLALVAAAAVSANAFKDTSPFLLFSSSPLPSSMEDAVQTQLQSRTSTLESAKSFLADCPSEIYYILTQPSLSSSELSSSAPHLKKATSNPGVRSRISVAETVALETSDGDELARYVQENCGATKAESFAMSDVVKERVQGGSVVVRGNFGSLSTINGERKEQLEDADAFLYNQVLKELPKGYNYTVIYISTSPSRSAESPPLYEASFNEPVHMELRRNLQSRDHTYPEGEDVRPLFEKYAFLSPGLFMGILVSLILLAILSVGIRAVASLEVSYGAFDKDMGPAAQKKQQ